MTVFGRRMMGRLPVRVRLTAVFTAAMALALGGVGTGTALHFRHALDAALDDTLTDRAHDLAALPADTTADQIHADADVAAQLIAGDGQVLAASSSLGTTALLSAAQLAAVRRRPLHIDRSAAAGMPGRVRLLAIPAADATVVVAVASLTDRDHAIANLQTELLITLPLVLLITTTAAYLLAAASLRPVERMRAQAAAITEHTPGRRLPAPPGGDELARLAATLNDMLARLHLALTRERDFVADASHELRTPLALLKTELELALHRPRSPAETDAALREALADTDRLVDLAEELLLLARTDRNPGPATAPVALAPLLHDVAARSQAASGGRTVGIHCPDAFVAADGRHLERAMANLVDNALRHGAGAVEITAYFDGGQVVVTVRDHGPGFPPVFLPRAFDRFSRADPARSGTGTGLGLAIVAAITRRHGGNVHAANHPDGGAEITLCLPAATTPTPPRPADVRPEQETSRP